MGVVDETAGMDPVEVFKAAINERLPDATYVEVDDKLMMVVEPNGPVVQYSKKSIKTFYTYHGYAAWLELVSNVVAQLEGKAETVLEIFDGDQAVIAGRPL